MKTKHILALVTFVVTFVSSTVLVALLFPSAFKPTIRTVVYNQRYKNPMAQRMTEFLRKDINNGINRRDRFSEDRTLAVRTEDYVSASESMSYEEFPMDFQNAWEAHMRAWRKQADFLNSLDSDKYSDESMERMSYRNTEEINRTWYEVLRIARQNGAAIPAGAY